ncbi:hypothetical protein [Aporhodopirellula aestuarii]|uniref:Uncharacterized protein n=1 Tax=Aporhodopirellula aestuarii TaxID=2950107 RepID=A0ABT0U722_9BACT|nr:hypothetical protein [Aporhodopirellula aestuarii]MCM2372340.1 hypothetical protein [Aporhodopirellula aestuarii]
MTRFDLHSTTGNSLLPAMFSAVMLVAVGCDQSGTSRREDRETGPIDVSVVPEMLVGAQYRGRTGGDQYDDMIWRFDEMHFRIVAGRAGLPADLVRSLLPADATGYRIEGRWSVEDEVLTVSELAVDGKPVAQSPRTLQTMCTPVIRIHADKHQYMFARGTAESAWRQGDIPPWPPGTTSVSGSVIFDKQKEGWLSVGYHGIVEESDSIGDGATLNWEPDDSGYGSAQTTTFAPRFCRLQLNGSQPATVRGMALPPGVYLFYAKWKPSDLRVSEEKIVVEFTRWRLQGRFAAQWVVASQRPVSGLEFDLAATEFGELRVHAPASEPFQSAFLLPWSEPDVEPPPIDADQAWQMSRWAGHQVRIEAGKGLFPLVPAGRYRVFLVEHDVPVEDDDTVVKYRVSHDEVVMVRKDAVVGVTF